MRRAKNSRPANFTVRHGGPPCRPTSKLARWTSQTGALRLARACIPGTAHAVQRRGIQHRAARRCDCHPAALDTRNLLAVQPDCICIGCAARTTSCSGWLPSARRALRWWESMRRIRCGVGGTFIIGIGRTAMTLLLIERIEQFFFQKFEHLLPLSSTTLISSSDPRVIVTFGAGRQIVSHPDPPLPVQPLIRHHRQPRPQPARSRSRAALPRVSPRR